ncbi:MAG: hypothetical protein LBU16_02365 [Treponema sp.]|jgi:hypothetical protein|nr:hypothetical protein [Treponema sp.]
MATLKNPSIYDDRSTIGSADELDEYGVWVKIEPQELSDADTGHFPDFDADFGPEIFPDETIEDDAAFEDFAYSGDGEDANFDDIEALRQDIESAPTTEAIDDTAAGFALDESAFGEPALDESVFAESALDESPLGESALDESALDESALDESAFGEPALDESAFAEPALDESAFGEPAFAAPVLDEPDVVEPAIAEPVAAPADLSIQLLMKIADELSAIKNELSVLKGELSTIRSENPPPSAGGTEDAGFFDEEDDDKIALTGDELNNILHTADFTEETGFDTGDSLTDDFAPPEETEAADRPFPSDDGEEIIHDGLGKPLQAASQEDDDSSPAAAPLEAYSDAAETEIIYDGLGRPLNRTISEDDDIGSALDATFELEDSGDLKALQENGVEPMTPTPEDTSYLDEDPLAEESIDLSDAVIDEPDLSEGIMDAPLEEPSLDNFSLIDLEDIEKNGEKAEAGNEDLTGEKPFFEHITFEDLSDPMDPLEPASITDTGSLDEGEPIDLSIFEDDFPLENADIPDGPDSTDAENAEAISFEALDEDADLPVQQNVPDNVIAEESFESVSFDDEETNEVIADEDLEQSLPESMKIELENLSPLDFPALEDEEEVTPAITMELKDVLIYMDKLLESLPEEKINEFAQSEHYATYKKLFEELGIQQ